MSAISHLSFFSSLHFCPSLIWHACTPSVPIRAPHRPPFLRSSLPPLVWPHIRPSLLLTLCPRVTAHALPVFYSSLPYFIFGSLLVPLFCLCPLPKSGPFPPASLLPPSLFPSVPLISAPAGVLCPVLCSQLSLPPLPQPTASLTLNSPFLSTSSWALCAFLPPLHCPLWFPRGPVITPKGAQIGHDSSGH